MNEDHPVIKVRLNRRLNFVFTIYDFFLVRFKKINYIKVYPTDLQNMALGKGSNFRFLIYLYYLQYCCYFKGGKYKLLETARKGNATTTSITATRSKIMAIKLTVMTAAALTINN